MAPKGEQGAREKSSCLGARACLLPTTSEAVWALATVSLRARGTSSRNTDTGFCRTFAANTYPTTPNTLNPFLGIVAGYGRPALS